ncbi:MAG: hypothetical protein VW268_09155 [Rhodospirillaceae bacterium]
MSEKTPDDKKSDADAKAKPAKDRAAKDAKPSAPARAKPPPRTQPETDRGSTLWKGVALVLFVFGGLAVAGLLDYRTDLKRAQSDMTRLRAQVADERAAMQAAQDKFMRESQDIAARVEQAKADLTTTTADIEKRKAEVADLETKLAALVAEMEAALKGASEAAAKHATAQAALDKTQAEHAKLSAKVQTARAELGKLEKEAEDLLRGLKGSLGKLKSALDKL